MLPNIHIHPLCARQCPRSHGASFPSSGDARGEQAAHCVIQAVMKDARPVHKTEVSNIDVSVDPTGSSALAMAPHNIEKGFTTASSPTIPMSTAVLSFSCYYSPSSHTSPLSLTSSKARACPQRTSPVLEAAARGGKGKARQPSLLFPHCILFPSSFPLVPQLPSGCREVTAPPHLGTRPGRWRDTQGRAPVGVRAPMGV